VAGEEENNIPNPVMLATFSESVNRKVNVWLAPLPLLGETETAEGCGVGSNTLKATPLLATPPTVTMTLPLAAPAGTGATILVALQLVGVAAVPLNVTELAPCTLPKLLPVMVTAVPTVAEVGLRLEIWDVTGGVTVTPKP